MSSDRVERLVLVGCGAAKRDGAAPAKYLYTSTYFAKKREYAEVYADDWAIVSAKHGIVSPGSVIEPYDMTVDDLSEDELAILGWDVNGWVLERPEHAEELVVLAGRDYIEALRDYDAFYDLDVDVRFPLQEHGGIGEQMAWLSDRVQAAGKQATLVSSVDGTEDSVKQTTGVER